MREQGCRTSGGWGRSVDQGVIKRGEECPNCPVASPPERAVITIGHDVGLWHILHGFVLSSMVARPILVSFCTVFKKKSQPAKVLKDDKT